jgi:uncharacterized SAM-binding protein YcdF (DUF218 family)
VRTLLIRLLLTLALLWPASLALLDAYGLQDQARPADVIVILGSMVFPGARPGPSLTRRTQHAVALYARGLAPVIICSGGQAPNESASEASAACALAASLGVPARALIEEDQSRSTEENALDSAALMAAHGWHSAILSSDGYHLFRADLLFSRAGLLPWPSPAQATAGPMSLPERYLRETRELAALVWYVFKTALGLHITDFP